MKSCPSPGLSSYWFLHLCDSDEVVARQPGYDYLFKVRNLLDLLSPCFQSQYTHEELSVDEAMIPFRGRLRKTIQEG